jgi:hypothetical protein
MPIDPATGRDLPAGQPLAQGLAGFFTRQGQSVLHALTTGAAISLAGWNGLLVETVRPHITRYTGDGGRESMQRIYHQVRSGRKAAGTVDVGAFDLRNPRVLDAINAASLTLAASTNAMSQYGVEQARSELRQAMIDGMDRGEAYTRLRGRIELIFDNRARADMIARTESSRAVHGGQVLAAQESGVVKGLKWLPSSAPCEKCRKLAGKIVALGEPFFTDPRGGPYAVCYHPPLHPHCVCSILEELDWDAVHGKKPRLVVPPPAGMPWQIVTPLPLSMTPPPPIEQTLPEIEAKIAGLPREQGFIIGKDGTILAHLNQAGDTTELILTDEQERLAKDAVFTHNHPQASSFSVGDFFQAIRFDVAQCRVVSGRDQNGAVITHTITRPDAGWPTWGEMEHVVHEADMLAMAKMREIEEREGRRYDTPELKKLARKIMSEERSKELARLLGIRYETITTSAS